VSEIKKNVEDTQTLVGLLFKELNKWLEKNQTKPTRLAEDWTMVY